MFRVPTFPYDTASRRRSGSDRQQQQPPFRSPKVVSIPVHFMESEATMSKSTAAVKIQKVWRGYVAKKNVNKIVVIKREVDAIEKRITEKGTSGDAKERLKLNEILMALLFRLDSVEGVDSGVRDCRKRVIKKAIMLQERVDAFASCEDKDSPADSGQENLNSVRCEVEEELTDGGEISQGEQNQISQVEEEGCLVVNIEESESTETEQSKAAGYEEEKNCNKDLVEKMIERNEILIGLVSDLCEKNKIQTQMINCLAKRVDNLEKSLTTDRSKSKRRKQESRRNAT